MVTQTPVSEVAYQFLVPLLSPSFMTFAPTLSPNLKEVSRQQCFLKVCAILLRAKGWLGQWKFNLLHEF